MVCVAAGEKGEKQHDPAKFSKFNIIVITTTVYVYVYILLRRIIYTTDLGADNSRVRDANTTCLGKRSEKVPRRRIRCVSIKEYKTPSDAITTT